MIFFSKIFEAKAYRCIDILLCDKNIHNANINVPSLEFLESPSLKVSAFSDFSIM